MRPFVWPPGIKSRAVSAVIVVAALMVSDVSGWLVVRTLESHSRHTRECVVTGCAATVSLCEISINSPGIVGDFVFENVRIIARIIIRIQFAVAMITTMRADNGTTDDLSVVPVFQFQQSLGYSFVRVHNESRIVACISCGSSTNLNVHANQPYIRTNCKPQFRTAMRIGLIFSLNTMSRFIQLRMGE